MAARSVEMEIVSASSDGAGKVTVSLEYRLINENTQAVLATKTVGMEITEVDEIFDSSDLIARKFDEAVAWGQWLLAAQKASALVGKKRRTTIS